MKNLFKSTLILLISVILISCFPMQGSPMTAFIVKNTSEKPISFSASVIKMSQTFGPQEVTNSFTVKAKDSIIVRQTYFKKDGENPQKWFSKFDIFPVVIEVKVDADHSNVFVLSKSLAY